MVGPVIMAHEDNFNLLPLTERKSLFRLCLGLEEGVKRLKPWVERFSRTFFRIHLASSYPSPCNGFPPFCSWKVSPWPNSGPHVWDGVAVARPVRPCAETRP